jgi:hypothetical protein
LKTLPLGGAEMMTTGFEVGLVPAAPGLHAASRARLKNKRIEGRNEMFPIRNLFLQRIVDQRTVGAPIN